MGGLLINKANTPVLDVVVPILALRPLLPLVLTPFTIFFRACVLATVRIGPLDQSRSDNMITPVFVHQNAIDKHSGVHWDDVDDVAIKEF